MYQEILKLLGIDNEYSSLHDPFTGLEGMYQEILKLLGVDKEY